MNGMHVAGTKRSTGYLQALEAEYLEREKRLDAASKFLKWRSVVGLLLIALFLVLSVLVIMGMLP